MNASPDNLLIKSVDRVVDFATLGEYRVVTGAPVRETAEKDIWATDIEWSSAPRERGVACQLPRARDRKLARERISG